MLVKNLVRLLKGWLINNMSNNIECDFCGVVLTPDDFLEGTCGECGFPTEIIDEEN